jgi:hypothetical protein
MRQAAGTARPMHRRASAGRLDVLPARRAGPRERGAGGDDSAVLTGRRRQSRRIKTAAVPDHVLTRRPPARHGETDVTRSGSAHQRAMVGLLKGTPLVQEGA